MLRAVNASLVLAIVLVPAALAAFGKEAAGALLLSALVVALLVVNVGPDRVEEIALGPMKAKLREKIAEVDGLSDTLKHAITTVLTIGVSGAMRTGRFADPTYEFRGRLYEMVRDTVTKTGLSEADLQAILTDFYYLNEIDMRRQLLGSRVHSGSATGPLADSIRNDDLTPDERVKVMRELAELYGKVGRELEEWLLDYEVVAKERRLRRPEVWFAQKTSSDLGLIRSSAE